MSASTISQRPQEQECTQEHSIVQQQVLPVRNSSPSLKQNSISPYESCDDSSNIGHDVDSTMINEPGLYDILCGRHKVAFNHIGNRRFRVTISLSLDRYRGAPTRIDKSTVIKSVAASVQSNGGRFLQQRRGGGGWVELNEKQGHEKVGHALRDMAMSATKSESASFCPRAFSPAREIKSGFLPTIPGAMVITPQVSPERVILQDNRKVKRESAVHLDIEAFFVEPFELISAALFSNNEGLIEDDHSLASVFEDQYHAVEATAQVDAPPESTFL